MTMEVKYQPVSESSGLLYKDAKVVKNGLFRK